MATEDSTGIRKIAYFSMEIALENSMPSYSGGLGVLAGDTIRAAADLRTLRSPSRLLESRLSSMRAAWTTGRR